MGANLVRRGVCAIGFLLDRGVYPLNGVGMTVPIFGSDTPIGAELAVKTHAIWCSVARKFYRFDGKPVLMSEDIARANVAAWNAWGSEAYRVVPWDEQARAIAAGKAL